MMKKKLLALIAVAVIGLSACQKDEAVQPVKFPVEKVADKSNVGTWD